MSLHCGREGAEDPPKSVRECVCQTPRNHCMRCDAFMLHTCRLALRRHSHEFGAGCVGTCTVAHALRNAEEKAHTLRYSGGQRPDGEPLAHEHVPAWCIFQSTGDTARCVLAFCIHARLAEARERCGHDGLLSWLASEAFPRLSGALLASRVAEATARVMFICGPFDGTGRECRRISVVHCGRGPPPAPNSARSSPLGFG